MRIVTRARSRSGQTMAEFALVLAFVIAAVIAMSLYVKRGLEGKIKDVTDDLGTGLSTTNHTSQYEPYYASSDYNVGQSQAGQDQYNTGGKVFRDTKKEESTRTGSSTTAAIP